MAPGFCFAGRSVASDKSRMTISPLGDSAVVMTFGDRVDAAVAALVQAVAREIERDPPPGAVDVVPAFASVAVFFDPVRAPSFEKLRATLESVSARLVDSEPVSPMRTVDIPVCYGGEYGPDLEHVARHTTLSVAEVTKAHEDADYLVHAIGFAPGFPYLGGLPQGLATPRRATPRPQVPAGAVGIGGAQTGVYPLATPGGWNLIGRTPLRLFDATRSEPALLRSGDRVKFRAITSREFVEIESRYYDSSDTRAAAREDNIEKGQRSREPLSGMEVISGGMFTTVQDLGRVGQRSRGVPGGGAADPFALRLVNLLVGNPENAAGLEFTLVGPELKFHCDTVVAWGGAEVPGLDRNRPMVIKAGSTVKVGAIRSGCRAYLAVAVGIAVLPALGSRSTYAPGKIGGFCGRALQAGDVLPLLPTTREVADHWRIDARILPAYSAAPVVRVTLGAHADQFAQGWETKRFQVSTRSDRMGVRLTGDPLVRTGGVEMVSSPVAPGTVQVPPDGSPIVLLADAQTIGGYPQIAHVISVDLPLVAQLRPHDSVRFSVVSLDDARALVLAQERALTLLRAGLAGKLY